MAQAKKQDDDLGQSEVQEAVAADQEKGYHGVKVDPRPNSDYSLESGPNSPHPHETPRIDIADLKEE